MTYVRARVRGKLHIPYRHGWLGNEGIGLIRTGMDGEVKEQS